MNIGIITQLPYPHDREVRGKKIARTLHKEKHNVFIICPKKKEQPKKEKIEHAIIYRFGYCSSFYLINRILSITLPMNLLWTLWIFQIGRQERTNLLIVRDIRLVFPAILAAKFLGIPIIWDMAENHVAATEVLPKNNPWHYVIRNRKLISIIEKICVRFINYIWVVVKENKERLLKLGVPAKKIGVVSNTPILNSLPNKKNDKLARYKTKEKFVALYVGNVTKLRGLELILLSIPHILKKDINIEMVIVGDGPDRPRLENLIYQLHIDKVVRFTGWIDSKNIPDIIKKCDIGLIPHHLTELTQTTIPNKLFDYMREGKPVLSTNMRPVRKVIEETKCGFIISNNPKKIASLILKLKKSPDLCKKVGQNGQQAILQKYNWKTESNVILRTIDNLCHK